MGSDIDILTWDMVHESSKKGGVQVYNKVIESYRGVVKDGLPDVTAPDGATVCIVGGGMSGLVAAELLSGVGYEVTILEGAERIGGRVHTVAFPDGDTSEAGAMRLLEGYQLVFDYIDKLGLKKIPFVNHDPKGRDWIAVNGLKVRRQKYLDYHDNYDIHHIYDILGFATEGDERIKTADVLWKNAIKNVTDLVKDCDTVEKWQRVIDRYGSYSVYTYLKQETALSQGAIDKIVVMLFLEARMHLSLLQQVVETTDHGPHANYYGIKGGMARLPEALLASVTNPDNNAKPVKVQFGSVVQGLQQNADASKVTVSWTTVPADAPPAPSGSGNDEIIYPRPLEQHSAEFDAAIVTCTPPATRRLRFEPPLSYEKQKALREINFSASTKIFLKFSEKFWVSEGFEHGSSVTDSAIRAVYYPSADDSTIVIASYTWAGAARGWDSLTPQERVDQALNDLVELHGEQIRDLYECGQSYSWLHDRFSMGEAAMIFPEQLTLQATLARPTGNIFFAGDTLSFKVAWIEGAIESGMRAALELVGLPPLMGATS